MTEVIRSRTNEKLRRARAAAAGKEKGFLCLEGDRLVDEAVRLGMALDLCLVSDDRPERADALAAAGVDARLCDRDLLQQASGLVTSPGVIAVAAEPAARPLATLADARFPLVAVACGIADPGNLGALARTAEAAGAGALILVGGARPWNGKALRGSMGSLLRLPLARVEAAAASEVRTVFGAAGYRQVRAATRGGRALGAFDWTPPVALWITSETGELPEAAADFEGVTIPMAGSVESLNVTVAAAVLLFAARLGQGGA